MERNYWSANVVPSSSPQIFKTLITRNGLSEIIVVTESSTVLKRNSNSLNTLQTSWLPVEIN